MTISSKFSSYWANSLWNLKKSSPLKLQSQSQPNFCWNDPWVVPFQIYVQHFNPPTKMATTAELNVWLQLAQWFLWRRFLCEFPIGSYVKLSSAVGAMLAEGPNCRTHFRKRSIQSLKLMNQSEPNFAEMILGWSPSKTVSGISDLRSRWPPQLNLI
jgi:hypothetical protein